MLPVKIAFILAVVAVVVFIICKLRKRDSVFCEVCGWEGEEEEVDTFSSLEQGNEEEALWFHFCPNCKSSKVIFPPSKEAHEVP